MQRKIAIFLSVLMFMLCLPVSAVAVSASGKVTIQTEIFSGFDITIPQSIAQKYRWEENGFEGSNSIRFYDRAKYDAADGTGNYEEPAKGYLFSIRQDYYDGDYRYGMGDPLFYELFQPTRNEIASFYSRGDLSKLMILYVEYADSAPVSVEKDALKIAGSMTPVSDVCMEDVDANPWNLKFANFLLNGRFRTMGQEYFDDAEMQACLCNVAGNDYPELIITNGAADAASSRAYVYTFSENWQVEYLRTATTEELNAMPLQTFTAIRMGWGDFLEACGYQIEYLPEQISPADWLGAYRYDDGNEGELYIVKESDDSEVRGVYVFRRTDGGYDSRDFVWSKDDSTTASEPFQNGGSDRIFHYLKGDRIVSDYPDGWWSDREYVWVSSVGDADKYMPGIPVSYAGASVKFRDSLFEKSANAYDNELAVLGGILSCAMEKSEEDIVDLLQEIGVESCYTDNFGKGEKFAYAVAHKEVELNGQDTNLLFVVARGTVNLKESLDDASGETNPFFDYIAYKYAWDFYVEINNGIADYLKYNAPNLLDKPLKVFVTGHSLGGAAANLVAANFTLYDWWSNYLSSEDVFAYTYGALDSLSVEENPGTPVARGFENIHNIYNFYDTYGPNGIQWGPKAAGNDMYGKFGHLHLFYHQYSTKNGLKHNDNHIMENYLKSLVSGEVPSQCNDMPFSGSHAWCPVDIEVLKDGEVVGRIVDNQVDEELLAAHPEVAMLVVEDSKHIGVFDNPKAYSLRITATDDGEMSVSTVSFDDTGESYGAAEYPNVEIKTGQVFSMDLPASDSDGSDSQTPELLVMDGDRVIGKVNTDGSISSIREAGNGWQLAQLIAIVAIGGLIVFLGGRNMNETKKVKFPIASIFTVILAFGLLGNLPWLRARSGWMDSKIGYRMVVEFGSTYSVSHILYQVLLICSMILLAVLLFMRKRNGLLAGALGIQALLPAFTFVSFFLNCGSRGFFVVGEYRMHLGPVRIGPEMWAIGICGCYTLEILC